MRPKFAGAVLVAVLLGTTVGIGAYTFVYSKGYSYLSNNPGACANCHVMQSYYDAWIKSSHRSVAVCNDCHTPHNLVGKYATKASNGFFHSLAFTSGRFPDSIDIKPRNYRVTEAACRHCHQDIVSAIDGWHRQAAGMSCTRCHSSVGHTETAASLPHTTPQGKSDE